jgi:hypothetical protein
VEAAVLKWQGWVPIPHKISLGVGSLFRVTNLNIGMKSKQGFAKRLGY